MKSNLETLSKTLEDFKDVGESIEHLLLSLWVTYLRSGIPCINLAQERSTRMLMNASTVATFFAGVAGKCLGELDIYQAENHPSYDSTILDRSPAKCRGERRYGYDSCKDFVV